jgi:hypothetical protein
MTNEHDSFSNCRNCDQARQGVTGVGVRHVLGWGILGTVLAFAAVIALA